MAQQGFVYEQNTVAFLKPYKLVPKSFTPAGASHDQPDLLLDYNKKQSGCELKITGASAGSLILKYISSERRPWTFNDIPREEKEKWFIKNLALKLGLFELINRHWKHVPYKREKDATWDATAGKVPQEKRYERDKKLFPDIRGEVDAREIERYYNQKNTYYVNVGTHGFYLFGAHDPLYLNTELTKAQEPPVPTFGRSAKAVYRARCQYKGGGQYQFIFEMNFNIHTKSVYNIAPLVPGSVAIQKQLANLSCFYSL